MILTALTTSPNTLLVRFLPTIRLGTSTLLPFLSKPRRCLPSNRSIKTDSIPNNRVPITSLLNSVEKIIQLVPPTKAEKIEQFIHRRLDEKQFHITKRHVLFEKLISLLIHHHHFSEAGTVYERLLEEGYISTLKTDAQMLAIGLVLSPDQYDKVISSLQLIFASKEFSEDDFILLLGVLQDLSATPRLMIQVIQEFLKSHEESYVPHRRLVNILVGMMVKEGLVREAFGLIDDYDSESDEVTRSHPYASIISSLDTFDPLSEKSINDVLTAIREKEIQYDASIFNSLLSHQVRKKDVDKAFMLYETLMDITKEGFTSPDHYTFRNLFKLISRLDTSSSLPVSPRHLFRDMLTVVLSSQKDKITIDNCYSLMIYSLQAFLSRCDYAAAYCLTQILVKVGLPITAQIYFTVIKHVASRVLKDIFQAQKTGGSCWMHRLLGCSRSDFERMKEVRHHNAIMLEVLRKSKKAGVLLDLGVVPSRAQRQFVVPTLSMMKKQAVLHSRLLFDVIPLQRVLRRAMLAEVEQEKNVVFGNAPEARRATGELIAVASAEMTPEGVELRRFEPAEWYFTKKIWL